MVTINKLIQKHQAYLYTRAKYLTATNEEAKDLLQDAIVRIIEQQDKYDVSRSFKAWSTQVIRNLYINQYNRRKRYQVFPFPVKELDSLLKNTWNEAEGNLAVESLQLAIDQLALPHQKAFRLFFEGYPQKEIADQFQLPIGTVKYHIFMAKKELQRRVS